MEIYISILRGINVGGQKSVKMDALREVCEKLGFKNVLTYVQSGNIIFHYRSEEPRAIEQKIQKQIKSVFGFDVPVIVLTLRTLKRIIDSNPFHEDQEKEKSFLHCTFLGSAPENYDLENILSKKTGQEEIVFTNEAVYLFCPHGYGKTKLNNNFLENKLQVSATTRNWKTTLKLLELAQN